MKNIEARLGFIKAVMMVLALLPAFISVFWDVLPPLCIRAVLMASGVAAVLLIYLWDWCVRQQQIDFANAICETADALMDGRKPDHRRLFEDSQASKVQGKLLRYYDCIKQGQRQSEEDKQTMQELVSDISHQVKTPLTNLLMFASILKQRTLTEEKRSEFLATMTAQIQKLDFLMQSLIKMSRLETGTFTMHVEMRSLYETIARALNDVWAKAAQKNVQITVSCDSQVTVRHDEKWTAEALGNILDNAVKYTPRGGSIRISVFPWQFYTRIDISDTGIGIDPVHYHDVFRRFYRAQEAAPAEGVGLGLYLARSIITRQKGYISVKSKPGKGATFSVFLLN